MEFFDVLNVRRSVRAFAEQAVEPEKLRVILDAIRCAPSAGNLQSYRVFVVNRPELMARLAAAAWGQKFIAQAPVALVFCADAERAAGRYGERGAALYAVQDATIACTYAHLAAAATGLASVWIGAFGEDAVRRLIGAPAHLRPVACLPLGYAAATPAPTPRRPLAELVEYVV